MRQLLAALLCVGLVAGAASAGEPNPDEIIKQLLGQAEAPKRSAQQLDAAYAAAIGKLAAGLAVDDPAQMSGPDRQLEELCHRASAPGREEHRAAAVKALVAALKAKSTPLGHTRIIRHLERIGRADAVPALAALLSNQDLREPARRALARNPASEATAALMAALPKADKPFRIGLIDALGLRRAKVALKLLAAQAAAADEQVRTHACEALARIGDGSAAGVIAAATTKGSAQAQRDATGAYLALADALVAQGDKAAAYRIYSALVGAKNYVRNAALIGLGKAGSAKDVDALVAALDGADAERGAATDALLLLEGKAATAAIAAKAEGAKAPAKAILVGVLGQRGDAAAVPAVVAAAKDKDEAVRVAAYGALGALKSEAGIEALLGALLSEKAATRDRAEWALSRIPGDAATQAILKALDSLQPQAVGPQEQAEAKTVLVRSLGSRRDARTLDRLAAITRDPVDDVRAAAFRALAMLNDLRAIPAILKALETEKGKARDAAIYALRRAHGKEATAAIVKAAKTAPAAALAPILRVLSWRDDPAVQQFLVANANNGDATVRAAALDGLGRIKDAAAVPSIIEAATKGEGEVRSAAVRTSLVYTDEITKADPTAAKAIYLLALDHKVVPHHDDRRAALRALGKVGDADTVAPLADALRDRRLSGDAHGAIESIARRLVKAGQKDQGIAALLTMARRSNDHGRIRRAQQELKKLGVQGELPLAVGFVTHWHVCGPFPNPKNALFGAALPPEKDGKADVTKPVAAGGTTCAWKPFLSTDAAGVVDLESELKKNDEQAALLYAEVSVAEAADVYLRLGYDEGCIAYVNGKKVHSRSGSRWRVDDQRAKAKLVAGTNTVLLKITNLGPGWRASCRIIGTKNEAVPFTQGGK